MGGGRTTSGTTPGLGDAGVDEGPGGGAPTGDETMEGGGVFTALAHDTGLAAAEDEETGVGAIICCCD